MNTTALRPPPSTLELRPPKSKRKDHSMPIKTVRSNQSTDHSGQEFYIEVRFLGSSVVVSLVLRDESMMVFDSVAADNTSEAIQNAEKILIDRYAQFKRETTS